MFGTALRIEKEEKSKNPVVERLDRNVKKPDCTGTAAQLNAKPDALGYTREDQIEISPGQEWNLPHELGYVVQQKLGVVRANARYSGGQATVQRCGKNRFELLASDDESDEEPQQEESQQEVDQDEIKARFSDIIPKIRAIFNTGSVSGNQSTGCIAAAYVYLNNGPEKSYKSFSKIQSNKEEDVKKYFDLRKLGITFAPYISPQMLKRYIPFEDNSQEHPDSKYKINSDRTYDAEAKILENIIRDYNLANDPNGCRGSIYLCSELPCCASCKNIIAEFRERFEQIKLYVYWISKSEGGALELKPFDNP